MLRGDCLHLDTGPWLRNWWRLRGLGIAPIATSGDLIRALIREHMERQAVIDGYDDVLAGRVLPYSGDLRSMLDAFRDRRQR